jgi:DNA gyrase/topoisomerase IV subunit A
VEDELDTLKKEQEDLLVLLADQDTKIDKYKKKLKELGQRACVAHLSFCLEIDQSKTRIACGSHVC